MGNMGTIPAAGYESSVVQTFSTPTGTSHTMTYTAGVNDMILVINNVIQEPTVAYTTSGTTLTTGTLVSGDTMYIIFLALTRQTSAPGADTVTNAMIVDNAINSEHYTDGSIDLAHMSVNSIDSDQYVDGSIDAAHLADDAVGVAELSATGTASSSTFLRGDNAWAAAGGGKVVQLVRDSDVTHATGTSTIALDDTLPQIGEGFEIQTLAITPTNSSNFLVIRWSGLVGSGAAAYCTCALFQDSTSNALCSNTFISAGGGQVHSLSWDYVMLAGTTSSTTFSTRLGGNQATTYAINGTDSARKYGGSANATLTIMEVEV